ncbi:hypothetical protein [Nitratireductor luteus]|uniref:hypothetical protein n=1 Tax=Nitratireductor luteus TaxID=2976980 RepID=UPI0022404493|nr:hypothetical protein [Nitratireductor luteus]
MTAKRKAETAKEIRESDLAQEKMGKNKLQGDDQLSVRNQRRAVPDVKSEPDDLLESFEKLDKDKRARTDLGKGARKSGSK